MKRLKLYYTTWCSSCIKVKTIIKKLEHKFDNIIFEYIDMDNITEVHTIKSVPTVIIERDGIEIRRIVGLQLQYVYEYELKKL